MILIWLYYSNILLWNAYTFTGLVSHASVYHPESRAVYIIPGEEPEESIDSTSGMYILDVHHYAWSKRQYSNLVKRILSYIIYLFK